MSGPKKGVEGESGQETDHAQEHEDTPEHVHEDTPEHEHEDTPEHEHVHVHGGFGEPGGDPGVRGVAGDGDGDGEEPGPELPGDPPGLPPRLTARLIVVFYALMVGLALLLGWIFEIPSLLRLPEGAKLLPEGPIAWAAGIALGLVAHGLGELAGRKFEWAKSFHQRMAELLGPVSRPWVIVAAASSGFAEELLFRGALLPLTGLWFQAFLFGLVHVGPDRSMRFWPYYAAVMGVLFGVLYQQSGSLLAPVLAHFTVNYFGLSALVRPATDPSSGPPR